MPVFNSGAWLEQAIESIRGQSFTDFELIVIDDGSTDQTGQIVEEAARVDVRIRSVPQEHLGIGAALNRGAALARAPVIARMDADDVAAPDRLRIQLAFLDAHSGVAAVGSWAHVIDDAGRRIGDRRPATGPSQLRDILLRQNPFTHASMMMRADAFRGLGGYRPVLDGAEDYDLWLRMSERAELANIPEFLLSYRSSATPCSTAAARKQLLAARLARLSAKARRESRPDFVDTLAVPLDFAALRGRDDLVVTADVYELLGRAATDRFFVRDLSVFGKLDLDHAERRAAQFWLKDLLAGPQSIAVRAAAAFWLLRLHPARGLSLLGSGQRRR
jgi:glycosyltransferase involved in cell wall biosynthesis